MTTSIRILKTQFPAVLLATAQTDGAPPDDAEVTKVLRENGGDFLLPNDVWHTDDGKFHVRRAAARDT